MIKQKIYFIDPNNETGQLSYPLLETLKDYFDKEIVFISSFNRHITYYYDLTYNINVKYLFFKFANKISNKRLRQIFKGISYPFNCFKLIHDINLGKPDIVHINFLPLPFISYLLIKYLKFKGIKIVLTLHNYAQHDRSKLRLFETEIFNEVDRIICLSKYIKNLVDKNYSSKSLFIEHGNCYSKEINTYKRKSKNNLKNSFRLVFTGSIRPYKGINILINAADYIKTNKLIDDFYIIIAGSCSNDYLKKILNDIQIKNLNKHIDLRPKFQSYQEMIELISNSDAGVLPYLNASQSGLPFIYLSLYKPIIVTNVGALPEQVSEDFAVIVEPDYINLAYGIVKMHQIINENLIDSDVIEKYLNKYNWLSTVSKYSSLYNSLIR